MYLVSIDPMDRSIIVKSMYLLDKQVSCRVHKYIIQTSGWGENVLNKDINLLEIGDKGREGDEKIDI